MSERKADFASKDRIDLLQLSRTYQYFCSICCREAAAADLTGAAVSGQYTLPNSSQRPDPEVARDGAAALKHELPLVRDHECSVRPWAGRQEAERTARRAPAVTEVENHVTIYL
jgi:hypothetical protein